MTIDDLEISQIILLSSSLFLHLVALDFQLCAEFCYETANYCV